MSSTNVRPATISRTPGPFDSHESRLLLHASRASLDDARLSAIRELVRSGPDWERVVSMAEQHQVAPLLYKALCAAGGDGVPAAALGRLARLARDAALRGLYLTAELRALLDELERMGVPAIPFKGPTLAQMLYGNAGLRECGDLDLLVPKERVLEIKDLLLARGFERERRLGPLKERLHLAVHCEYNFRRPDGLPVEIHWRFFPVQIRFPVRMSEVWSKAAPEPLLGKTVLALAPDDLLLLLCAHGGGKHGWRLLRWISDVADLIRVRGAAIDWDALCARAAASGCRRMLAVGLLLARDVLEAPVPDPALAFARGDRTALRLRDRISWMLFNGTTEDENGLHKSLQYLRLRERARDRVAYTPQVLAKLAKPSDRDRAIIRLPRGLEALYLPLRAARLAIKYAAMARRKAAAVRRDARVGWGGATRGISGGAR